MSETARTTPVRARHAASLIVVSGDGTPNPAVLMGLRGAGHRFMPNKLVFPGGAVDPEDFDAPAASALAADTAAALERSAPRRLAHALGIAAARELHEETGLTLGTPPALDGLSYLCRAITPPSMPVRFNARFLVVDRARVTGTLAGSGELEGLQEYPVAETLALDLAWITKRVMRHLTDWLAMTPEQRQARTQFPLCLKQVWSME